jgi:hypothetical protein
MDKGAVHIYVDGVEAKQFGWRTGRSAPRCCATNKPRDCDALTVHPRVEAARCPCLATGAVGGGHPSRVVAVEAEWRGRDSERVYGRVEQSGWVQTPGLPTGVDACGCGANTGWRSSPCTRNDRCEGLANGQCNVGSITSGEEAGQCSIWAGWGNMTNNQARASQNDCPQFSSTATYNVGVI